MALALSAPTVPLLVVYLAVLFTVRKAGSKSERDERVTLLPAGLFLLAFVIAFVITISGKPSLIANSVYRGKWIVNIIGGLLVAFFGLKAFAKSGLVKSLPLAPVLKGRGEGLLLWPSVLGLITGLLVFHHLDPYYDSVFFFTGRVGAFSHHPLSVGSFGLGLSAMYLGVAHGLSVMATSWRLAKGNGWLKLIFGLLTLILGFSFATGTFSSVVEVIRWPSALVSGS